jgi:pimeloyl-ACP methyl ester carboxylesterase
MTGNRIFNLIALTCALVQGSAVGAQAAGMIPAPPGRMIDLGGYKLHLNCLGEGSPTVVLEAAFGGSSLDWEKVQTPAARIARVCSYDRAGFGWSEAGSKPRDSKSIAQELRQLLQDGKITGPYILVAHSLGGFHVRMFAAQHPTEVVGMILLDASHEDQFGWKTATYWDVPTPKDLPPPKRFPDMKRTAAAETLVTAMSQQAKWKQATELENGSISESVSQLRAAGPLPNIPLLVLSAGAERPLNAFWTERELKHHQLQAKLVALSPKAEQIRVPESDHYIHLDRPDLVVESIRRLVSASRDLVKKQ